MKGTVDHKGVQGEIDTVKLSSCAMGTWIKSRRGKISGGPFKCLAFNSKDQSSLYFHTDCIAVIERSMAGLDRYFCRSTPWAPTMSLCFFEASDMWRGVARIAH